MLVIANYHLISKAHVEHGLSFVKRLVIDFFVFDNADNNVPGKVERDYPAHKTIRDKIRNHKVILPIFNRC